MAGWKLRKDKASAETPGTEAEAALPAEHGASNGSAPSASNGQETPAFSLPDSSLSDSSLSDSSLSDSSLSDSSLSDSSLSDSSLSDSSLLNEPEFEAGSDLHFTDLSFDDDKPSDVLPQHDDGPLTLVDYTAPVPLDAAPDSWFLGASAMEAAAEPPAPGAAVYEMPPTAEPEFAPETDPEPDFSTPEFPAPLSFAPIPAEPIAAVPIAAVPPPAEPMSSELISPELMSPEFGAAIPSVAPFVLNTPLPDALPDAPPQLVVHFGRLSAAFPLTKDVTTIGRPDSSLHYYPDVEIEMDDAISRRHAEVVKRTDGYYLVDTGSTNGTLLNGERLPSHEERHLMHGDRIKVGDRTEITFE